MSGFQNFLNVLIRDLWKLFLDRKDLRVSFNFTTIGLYSKLITSWAIMCVVWSRSGYRDDGRNFYGGKSSVNYHNQHKKDINSPNKPGNSSASGYGVRKPFNGKYKGGNRSGNFGGIGAYGHRNNDYSSMVHHQNRHRKSPATFNQSRDNYQGNYRLQLFA